MIHFPPLAFAALSRLPFIRHQHDSVFSADPLQTLEEFRRSQDVTALALNWLDKNPRDLFGVHAAPEQFIFQIAQAVRRSGFRPDSIGSAISVGIRHVKHAGKQSSKSLSLDRAS